MELSIRKLGNSVGLILPAALLRTLDFSIGSVVKAKQVGGTLIITPATKTSYSLSELLARCDVKAAEPKDMEGWG